MTYHDLPMKNYDVPQLFSCLPGAKSSASHSAIATPAQPQRSHLHLVALVARRPQQHSATALAAPEAVGAAVEGQAAPMGTQETTWGMALPEPFS